MCVLTSLPRRVLDRVVDAAGLRRCIDLALSPEDVPRGFPAPDLVLTSVLQTGTGSVGEVAVIHGTGAGVESGRRSGASIVAGVLTGPHPAERLRSAGATHVLESIADLPGLLHADDAAFRPDLSASARTVTPAECIRLGLRQLRPQPTRANPASIDVPAQASFGRPKLGRYLSA